MADERTGKQQRRAEKKLRKQQEHKAGKQQTRDRKDKLVAGHHFFLKPQKTEVEGLLHWKRVKESSYRDWFDLAQYVFNEPDSHYSDKNPTGLTEQDLDLLLKSWDRDPSTTTYGEQGAWERSFQLGFNQKFYAYCERKLKAGDLPEDWHPTMFPTETINVREKAWKWLRQYKALYEPDSPMPEYPPVKVTVLPDLGALAEDDVELKAAWSRYLKNLSKHPEILSVLEAPSRKVTALMYAGKPEEANAAMMELGRTIQESVDKKFMDQPSLAELNDSIAELYDIMALAVKKHAGHPKHLDHPNESTKNALDKLRAILDKKFPVEDNEKLEAACPGWSSLTPEKQDELIGKNYALRSAFEKYSKNTETHNALYDLIYERLNEGLAPRAWAVMAAGLALRILPTLPELHAREATSRARNEHSLEAYLPNILDESRGKHAVLFFDFVRSMHHIAPDQPLVDNMRKYDMLLQLLRYKGQGITFDPKDKKVLEKFEEQVTSDGIPLAYMKHAAFEGDIKWDGFENVDPSPEKQKEDLVAMLDLLKDLQPELADYATKSTNFSFELAKKYNLYTTSIIETLGTMTRENSTDEGSDTYMKAMLLLMQLHLGYLPDKDARVKALKWPFVHIGVEASGKKAGVEVDHAAKVLEALEKHLSIAKMDDTGRFADWLTEAFEAMFGEKGFQNLHYRHYQMMADAMRVHNAKDAPVPPKPLRPELYGKRQGDDLERLAESLATLTDGMSLDDITLIKADMRSHAGENTSVRWRVRDNPNSLISKWEAPTILGNANMSNIYRAK